MSGCLSCTSVTPDTQPCSSGDEDGMGRGYEGSSERGGPWAVGAEHRQSQLRRPLQGSSQGLFKCPGFSAVPHLTPPSSNYLEVPPLFLCLPHYLVSTKGTNLTLLPTISPLSTNTMGRQGWVKGLFLEVTVLGVKVPKRVTGGQELQPAQPWGLGFPAHCFRLWGNFSSPEHNTR